MVYRNPNPEGYSAPLTRTEQDTVSPLFAPEVTISVAEIFAPLSEVIAENVTSN